MKNECPHKMKFPYCSLCHIKLKKGKEKNKKERVIKI